MDYMIIYRQVLRNLQTTIRTDSFDKVTGYKINTQKSILLLYSSKILEQQVFSSPFIGNIFHPHCIALVPFVKYQMT